MPTVVRRLGWFWWGMIALGLVVAACAVFLVVQFATAASVGGVAPLDGAVLASSRVEISAELPGFVPGEADVELLIDDAPVDAAALQLLPDSVGCSVDLADGRHIASVNYRSTNAFSSRLVRRWAFVVDTTPPQIEVVSPAAPERLDVTPSYFRIDLNEPGTVTLTVDGYPVTLEQGGTFAAADVAVPEGVHDMRVEAVDSVGNASFLEWRCFADYKGPRIEVADEPGERITETSLTIEFSVKDNLVQGLVVNASIDGTPLPMVDAEPPEGSSGPLVRGYRIDTGEISEGLHTLVITATDWGGHTATYTRQFTVDSTGLFGARSMRQGAIGEDVKQLQQILTDKGYYQGEINGYFDGITVAAVKAYRVDRGLPAGAGVDIAMRLAPLRHIVIDRSDCTLTLYDENGVVKTYGCAVGMEEYPTPLGSFQIISKIYHPAWSPPPSPWAEKLEPVPPGVGNPLGTRWMGLTAPYVGIHGTYEDWSIGLWASHGCIRMHIPDVEELFEMVAIGTPVDIVR